VLFWSPPLGAGFGSESLPGFVLAATALAVAYFFGARLESWLHGAAAMMFAATCTALIEMFRVLAWHSWDQNAGMPVVLLVTAATAIGASGIVFAVTREPRRSLPIACCVAAVLLTTLFGSLIVYGRGAPPGHLEMIAREPVVVEVPFRSRARVGDWTVMHNAASFGRGSGRELELRYGRVFGLEAPLSAGFGRVGCERFTQGEVPIEIRQIEGMYLLTGRGALDGATAVPPHCLLRADARAQGALSLRDRGHPRRCSRPVSGSALAAMCALLAGLILAFVGFRRVRRVTRGVDAISDGEGGLVAGGRHFVPATVETLPAGPVVVDLRGETAIYRQPSVPYATVVAHGTRKDALARFERALLVALVLVIGALFVWILPMLILAVTPHIVVL
jgi:hypothetical protein